MGFDGARLENWSWQLRYHRLMESYNDLRRREGQLLADLAMARAVIRTVARSAPPWELGPGMAEALSAAIHEGD